jgi:hypothetical protein
MQGEVSSMKKVMELPQDEDKSEQYLFQHRVIALVWGQ